MIPQTAYVWWIVLIFALFVVLTRPTANDIDEVSRQQADEMKAKAAAFLAFTMFVFVWQATGRYDAMGYAWIGILAPYAELRYREGAAVQSMVIIACATCLFYMAHVF